MSPVSGQVIRFVVVRRRAPSFGNTRQSRRKSPVRTAESGRLPDSQPCRVVTSTRHECAGASAAAEFGDPGGFEGVYGGWVVALAGVGGEAEAGGFDLVDGGAAVVFVGGSVEEVG